MPPPDACRDRRFWLGLVAVAALATNGRATEAAEPLRILFVGNSLTTANDLPATVAAMPCLADGRTLEIATVVAPDTSLADHLARGEVITRLRRERWHLVVLQQGPSALEESRTQLLASVGQLAPLIRAAGARPAMFMVWPSMERLGDRDRVSESYRLAAQAVNAVLFPVGDAWRAALARDPGLPLYGNDGFHPSPLGSDLAALVICAAIGNRAPADIARSPPMSRRREFAGVRDALVAAAADARR